MGSETLRFGDDVLEDEGYQREVDLAVENPIITGSGMSDLALRWLIKHGVSGEILVLLQDFQELVPPMSSLPKPVGSHMRARLDVSKRSIRIQAGGADFPVVSFVRREVAQMRRKVVGKTEIIGFLLALMWDPSRCEGPSVIMKCEGDAG